MLTILVSVMTDQDSLLTFERMHLNRSH